MTKPFPVMNGVELSALKENAVEFIFEILYLSVRIRSNENIKNIIIITAKIFSLNKRVNVLYRPIIVVSFAIFILMSFLIITKILKKTC